MAERALRGTSIGSKSLETEDGVVFAERRESLYICPQGHRFHMTFAAEVSAPAEWECKCGEMGELQYEEPAVEEDVKPVRPQRTHWDMLLERRSEEELQQLLKEQLEVLHSGALIDGVHYR